MALHASAKRVIENALKPFDVALVRQSQSYTSNRATILGRLGIDLLFDVGANTGQYAREVRSSGYRGRIVSVEPIPSCFSRLLREQARDPLWTGICAAAGAAPGRAVLNITSDLVTSSILSPSDYLNRSIPSSKVIDTLEVDVISIDDVWRTERGSADRPGLKIDVQGFEKHVLEGARNLVSELTYLEIELSVMPTYQNGYNLTDGILHLADLGFNLISIGRGYSDKTSGTLADADLIFTKT